MRDGALENDIVVHENTHGMTNRMTGGGTADCLQTVEAAGLGEGMGYLFLCTWALIVPIGWSDAVAEYVQFDRHLHVLSDMIWKDGQSTTQALYQIMSWDSML